MISATKSRLSASFPNEMPIESEIDANLLGSDNYVKEESMGKFGGGRTQNFKSLRGDAR